MKLVVDKVAMGRGSPLSATQPVGASQEELSRGRHPMLTVIFGMVIRNSLVSDE